MICTVLNYSHLPVRQYQRVVDFRAGEVIVPFAFLNFYILHLCH